MADRLKFNLKLLVIILSVILTLNTCDYVVIWPTVVITTEPSGISQERVTLNGQVIIDKFTTAGFEWGPTTDYGTTVDRVNYSSGGDRYIYVNSLITSLSPATTYHYRVKIESSEGIIYGNDVAFTTSDSKIVFNPDVTYGSVNDIDGNTYKTIQIGTQTWMAENLRTTKYNNGTPVKLIVDYKEWMLSDSAAYSWVNNEGDKFKAIYGAMYSWRAVNTNKLCPEGWHVPNNAEWTTFTTYLGGPTNAGFKIKETGDTHWLNPNSNTTNASGFTALPAGYRNFDGSFKPGSNYAYWRGTEAYWWSSSTGSQGLAYYWVLYSNSNTLQWGSWVTKQGLPVRCLKD